MEWMSFSVLTATATETPTHVPGSVRRSEGGVIARYCQAHSVCDGNTLAAGEPALFCAAAAAWNSPYRLYVATNDEAEAIGGAVTCLEAGIAAVAIPESYWAWLIVKGYVNAVIADSGVTAGDKCKIAAATSGLEVSACTADEYCIFYPLTDDATNIVPGWADFPLFGNEAKVMA